MLVPLMPWHEHETAFEDLAENLASYWDVLRRDGGSSIGDRTIASVCGGA